MSRNNRGAAVLAAVAAALAVAALTAAPAGATRTVKISATLRISPSGERGVVKAANPNCDEQRRVVLKQKGHGVLGRTESEASGKWEINPETLRFKGTAPFKLYAEVKPLSQGTAGTIYICLGATSKTITIRGG